MVEMRSLGFDQQVEALAARGLGSAAELAELLAAGRVPEQGPRSLLAWSRETFPVEVASARIEREGKPVVFGHMDPSEQPGYLPIEAVELPQAPAYQALDVDLGAASRNVRPEDALAAILAAGRSPLTLDEGIALVLQQPDAIAVNWGFSAAGSRRGDQRVPAFWISEGRPKLGWCWDRNPHTWLGTASCAGRVAAA